MLLLTTSILGRRQISERMFRSLFGGPSNALAFVWNLIRISYYRPSQYSLKHFLMGVYFI
jgi:hypothetical protein